MIRFVENNSEIRKEFSGFLHCKLGLPGTALAEAVLNDIANLILDIHNCRGQGYYRASPVFDYNKGLSAQILCIDKKDFYNCVKFIRKSCKKEARTSFALF